MKAKPLFFQLTFLVLLAASANAELLKSIHSCYNTETMELGNLAAGKYGLATDGNTLTSTTIGSGIIINLTKSYKVTSYYLRTLISEKCSGTEQLIISASDNASNSSSFVEIFRTDPFGFEDPLGNEARNITPSKYQYWKIEHINSGCLTTQLYEIQLNSTPQTCYSDFFNIVNYTNSTAWTAVYAEYSFNQTTTNRNRVILEENSTGGNITELHNKFKDYNVQYSLAATYNNTENSIYAALKTSIANQQCRETVISKIDLTNRVSKEIALFDSGYGEDAHSMTIGFGSGFAYIGVTNRQDDQCTGSGSSKWKIHRIDLKTGVRSNWSNDSQVEFSSHNYFVPSRDVLLFPFSFEGNVVNKSYFWGVNSTDAFSGGPLYSSVGRNSQAYFVSSGKKVVFSSNQTGNYELYLIPGSCANACTPVRLTSTSENESILSVLDAPERSSFVVAYRTLENYYSVYAKEFHLLPFASSTSVNSTAANKTAFFTAAWQSANSLSSFIFSTNNSGAWVNFTPASLGGTQNSSNFTLQLNATPGKAIGWKFYAKDSDGKWGTAEGAFSTTDQDSPLYSNPSHNSTRAGEAVRFTVQWSDNHNLSNYTFGFDNGTGTFVNDSATFFSGTSALSDVVKIIGNLAGTVVRWIVYGRDAAGNFNATPIQSFNSVEATPPSVSLTQARFSTKSTSIPFNFTAADGSVLLSATLYATFGGSWAANSSNSSSLANASQNSISVAGIVEGNYAWNVLACDEAGNCAFAAANSSVTVDRTPPNASTSSVQANSTQPTISWTSNENSSALVEYWTGNATPSNTTNSSSSFNGTSHSVSLPGLSPATNYFYRTWTCDEAGNCAASTNANSFSTSSPASSAGSSASGGGGGGGFSFTRSSGEQNSEPASSAAQAAKNEAEKERLKAGSVESQTQKKNDSNAEIPSEKTAATAEPSPAATPAPNLILQVEPASKPPSAITGLALANFSSFQKSALLTAVILVALAVAAWRLAKKGSGKQEGAVIESGRQDFNFEREIEWVEWK